MSVTAEQTLCKQPSEKRKFEMHFANLLATGETLQSPVNVTSERIGGGTSDLIISGVAFVDNTKVSFWIDGGSVGRYRIEVLTDTSGGATLEGDGILRVTDK